MNDDIVKYAGHVKHAVHKGNMKCVAETVDVLKSIRLGAHCGVQCMRYGR